MRLPENGPITDTLIGQALGLAPNLGVGYYGANSHGKVNIWSKYKFVRVATTNPLTETDFKNANYGFIIDSNTSLIFTNTWGYLPPNTTAWAKRRGDMRGYDTAEGPPMVIASSYLNQVWNAFESNAPAFSCYPSYKVGGNSIYGTVNNRLNVEDLKISNTGTWQFKDLYFAVACNYGGTWHIVSAPNTLANYGGSGGAGISNLSGWSLYNVLRNLATNETVTIYPFLNTRNDRYSDGNGALGNIVPLPQLQPITFKKTSEWWLKLTPGSISCNYDGRFNFSIAQQDGTGYTNLASYKAAVQNSPSSGTFTLTIAITVSKATALGLTSIDLKDIQLYCNLFNDSSYRNVDEMNISWKLVYPSATGMPSSTQINKKITYNSSPSVDTSYNFDGLTPWDTYPSTRYMASFVITGVPVMVLQNNANADANLPSGARFTVNTALRIKGSDGGTSIFRVQEKRPYRFKAV